MLELCLFALGMQVEFLALLLRIFLHALKYYTKFKNIKNDGLGSSSNWVGVGVGLCDFMIDHRNLLPAIRTSVLYLCPMPQALAVEDMLIRTQQDIDLLIDVEVLEANGAASTSIDYVVDGCVFHWYVDMVESFVGVGLAATADYDQADADQW